jgi:carbamoyltransferase
MEEDEEFHPYEQHDPSILVDDLINGKIIGVVKNQSEHGPRALGNRSIICNPSIAEMKDILNDKVKHREWYRPFAPVVRQEDVSKYFEFEGESRWMSFCPKVRLEWRDKLAAITHVDNTARVQTVTREQNEFLYDLLTEFEKKTGVGVLLNTSFNVNGKPILSTYKDAFIIYNNTELDCLLLEDYYIRKEIFPSKQK